MKRKLLHYFFGALVVTHSPIVLADEKPSALYEDDAWWDVTEWFDGNDYNPTDEQWFRWDNETYEAPSAFNSSDTDNDSQIAGFDENSTSDSNWYYDYDYGDYYDYSDYDTDGMYEFAWRYHDYDGDGYYDAYSSYSDLDGDGFYDDYTFLTFANTDLDQLRKGEATKDAKSNVAKRSSKMYSVSGTVDSTKKVKTRDGEHLVAHVSSGDRKFVVELGAVKDTDVNIREGKELTARGPVTIVGEKSVLLAREVEYDGRSIQIDRSPRQLSGEVIEFRDAKLRMNQDAKHTLVRLKTKGDKQALIDLGPAERLSSKPEKGQSVEVSGVAVKIKERPVMMASSVTIDGKEMTINRGQKASDGESSPKKDAS